MHELSVARSLVSLASKEAEKIGKEVESVHIRVGALSGVVSEALLYAYDFAIEETILKGSKLIIEEVPAKIYCASCQVDTTLDNLKRFACQKCGELSSNLKAGRELDITYLEVRDD